MNSIEGICLTTAPEILKGESISKQSDLWSLGIIIYYMLFKEYPYNGKTEYQIIQEINSNKRLKNIGDRELNDLINRMLKINENERISWNNYFNHNFFKKDSIKQKLIKENKELKIIKEKIIKEDNEIKKQNKDYERKNKEIERKREELIKEIELLKKQNEKIKNKLKEKNEKKGKYEFKKK